MNRNRHLSFLKNKHLNERALYFGIGKTLDLYDESVGGIKVGAGDIVYHKIIMDYFFMTDPSYKEFGWYKDTETYRNYKPGIHKIYRNKTYKHITGMPPSEDAIYYDLGHRVDDTIDNIHDDITEAVGFGVTTSVDIMQFLIYMGFKEIVLIGHDIDYTNGSAIRNDHRCREDIIINKWELINYWLQEKHPDVSVMSVNPVNLMVFPEVTYEDLKCKKLA